MVISYRSTNTSINVNFAPLATMNTEHPKVLIPTTWGHQSFLPKRHLSPTAPSEGPRGYWKA